MVNIVERHWNNVFGKMAIENKELVVCLMDYWKYFDAMEPTFVKDFMILDPTSFVMP